VSGNNIFEETSNLEFTFSGRKNGNAGKNGIFRKVIWGDLFTRFSCAQQKDSLNP